MQARSKAVVSQQSPSERRSNEASVSCQLETLLGQQETTHSHNSSALRKA